MMHPYMARAGRETAALLRRVRTSASRKRGAIRLVYPERFPEHKAFIALVVPAAFAGRSKSGPLASLPERAPDIPVVQTPYGYGLLFVLLYPKVADPAELQKEAERRAEWVRTTLGVDAVIMRGKGRLKLLAALGAVSPDL